MNDFRYVLVFPVSLLLVLSGCAPENSEENSLKTGWSTEIQDTLKSGEESGNEFVKSVLADEKITDMEYQEALKKIDSCYASYNATVTYDKYWYQTVTSLDGKNDPLEIMGECSFADGGIAVLYNQMLLNPENLDDYQITAECLVRTGVVDKGFTAQDFQYLMESPESVQVPWGPGDKRVQTCYKDPLGIISGNDE